MLSSAAFLTFWYEVSWESFFTPEAWPSVTPLSFVSDDTVITMFAAGFFVDSDNFTSRGAGWRRKSFRQLSTGLFRYKIKMIVILLPPFNCCAQYHSAGKGFIKPLPLNTQSFLFTIFSWVLGHHGSWRKDLWEAELSSFTVILHSQQLCPNS